MKHNFKFFLHSIFIIFLFVGYVDAKDATSNDLGFVTSADGTQLHYFIEGNGIPCVVMGSTIYSSRTFSRNKLREHLSLIFMDTRLFVPSPPAVKVNKITIDILVDDIELLRKKLGFDKIALLGHSGMGLIAFEYARKYPEYTSHVIMVTMPTSNTNRSRKISAEYWETHASDERKKILKHNQEKLAKEDLSTASPIDIIRMQYLADTPELWYDSNYDGAWLWEGLEINIDIWNHFFGKIIDHYNIINGDPIEMPVFLALGRYDYRVPFQVWGDAQKNESSNLSYKLFDKSGHYPMIEEQELFDKELLEWISCP